MGILGTKMDTVQAAIKDPNRSFKDFGKKVDSKFDRLMYLVVRGVAGFDLYLNECNLNRTHA